MLIRLAKGKFGNLIAIGQRSAQFSGQSWIMVLKYSRYAIINKQMCYIRVWIRRYIILRSIQLLVI